MPTYWGLDLYMKPNSTSTNALNGRFETPTANTPRLSTATNPNGPWTAQPADKAKKFTVNAGDYLRINVIDTTNTITSVQMAAVFGRDNADQEGGAKSTPFVSTDGLVKCVVHGENRTVIGAYNTWWTGDKQVQAASGNYRFLIYVIAQQTVPGNQVVEWQFGHDPEMDVSGQR